MPSPKPQKTTEHTRCDSQRGSCCRPHNTIVGNGKVSLARGFGLPGIQVGDLSLHAAKTPKPPREYVRSEPSASLLSRSY